MPARRYDNYCAGARAIRWPFAVHEHEVRMTPLIAPEFQATFERILSTTRYYFHIEPGTGRPARRHSPSRR